jgi:hypothetical protein
MSGIKGPVILVGDNVVGLHNLQADFQAVERETLVVTEIGSIVSVCNDPINQPVVLFAHNTPIDSPEDIAAMRQFCKDYLGSSGVGQCRR